MSVRIVDVFSGAGGLSLGWLQACPESSLVAAIDSDATLHQCYEANFPGTRFIPHDFGDPYDLNETTTVLAKAGLERGDVDVLLAGPPCQTLSAAGKRTAHPDHRLAFHVWHLAEALLPKIILIENVPEFGRVDDGRLAGRLRAKLDAAGYATDLQVLAATSFGVPQNRTRCFIVGIRKEYGVRTSDRVLHQLVVPTHMAWNGGASQNGQLPYAETALLNPVTVGEAIDDLPSIAPGDGIDDGVLDSVPTSAYQVMLRDSLNRLYNHSTANHSDAMVRALALLKPGESPQQMLDHPLRRKDYFRAAYAKLDSLKPAPTMTTQTHNPGSGRFTHYRDPRVLSVREVARLQGFPDRVRFFGTQTGQRRHVGNAVPPILSEAIGRGLLSLIS